MPAKLAVANVTASDRDENVPRFTIDGDPATRWSAKGDGQWIKWDLGSIQRLSQVRIAFYKGDSRVNTFDLDVSDGATSTRVLERHTSSGQTTDFETFDFAPAKGRYVTYVGHASNVGPWNSLTEVEVWGDAESAQGSQPTVPNTSGQDAQPISPNNTGPSRLVPYPALPDPYIESTAYQVSARIPNQPDSHKIWTEQFRKGRRIHIASFSCTGPIEITVKANKPLTNPTIAPKSRQIEVRPGVDDHTVSFTIPHPEKLVLFPPEGSGLDPLYVFADPLEDAPPTITQRIEAGPHPQPITLTSNQTLYLAPGAVVTGAITIDSDQSNIKILGRGMIETKNTIDIKNCKSLTIDGITIRNVAGDKDNKNGQWTSRFRGCSDLHINGVKIFSFAENGDGIDPDSGSTGVTISDCFVSTGDDCIAIKSTNTDPTTNVEVRGCVVETYPGVKNVGGDGIKIGTETEGNIGNVVVQDCDVIRCHGSSTGVKGSSAFSIVHKGKKTIHDVHYTDIRVEGRMEPTNKNFEIAVLGSGSVNHVTLDNILWDVERAIRLHDSQLADDKDKPGDGDKDGGKRITGVTLHGCKIGKDAPRTLTSVHEQPMDVGDHADVTFPP